MYPKINQNIIMNIVGQEQSFRSNVAEIEKDEILIGFPVETEWGSILPEGTAVVVSYVLGGSLYRFPTQIIGRKNERIRLYRLAKPTEKEIEKIQRRDNFRVYSHLKLQINEQVLSTVNVSAGGLLFACNAEDRFEEEEIVSGTLFVPNTQNKGTESIAFQGNVRRMHQAENPAIKHVAIEFTRIHPRDEMILVQYCFDKQRQMR